MLTKVLKDGLKLLARNGANATFVEDSECIFYLRIIVPLHYNPAHHIQQVRQLQESAHVWVDLYGEVLQLLLGGVYAEDPQNIAQVLGCHQPSVLLIKLVE